MASSWGLSRPAQLLLLGTLALLAGAPALGCDSEHRDATAAPCDPSQSSGTEISEPGVLRGRVLAPGAQLAKNTAPGTMKTAASPHRKGATISRWIIGVADAAELDGELPVADIRLRLYRVDADGNQTGELLEEAQTNARGEWCMRVSKDLKFGADLMLEARAARDDNSTRLRRSVVADFSTDLYAGAEALTQFLQAQNVDFTQIPSAVYLNIESIADTRMDLLSPVRLGPESNIENTVRAILDALELDQRLQKKTEALKN